MPSISSTSGATQYGFQQLKLQMAQRNAEQAAQTAQALRTQANQAQQVAEQAKENARSLSVQSDQADRRAGQAWQGLAAMRSAQQAIGQLSNTVDQVIERQEPAAVATAPSATPPPTPTPAPVINTQGQVTGTTVNTTA